MNFTSSPYERMMKEVPRPGGGSDRCAGCRYFKECRSKTLRCLKRLRPAAPASGQVGAVDKVVDKREVFRYSIFSTCAT